MNGHDIFCIIAKTWLVLGFLFALLFWACCVIGARSDRKCLEPKRDMPERWTELDL